MLFQMVTGRLPFTNTNPAALLIAHLTQPPPDPRELAPNLPEELTYIIRRGLAKLPSERYAHVGNLVNDLENIQVGTT
ncbi:MAG TPA: hypothetical protein PLD47_02690 [Aggregatilineales bacterium]|nr:hypothetical protein [Anaerolineales bacterium]HRE46608.1 hypothetical protein [Aggregatilineales bacterium]